MSCTCGMAHVPKRGSPPTSSRAAEGSDGAPSAAPGEAPTASSRCFYCLCTVCGRCLPETPTVTCRTCGSQTHITCARDVYSLEWILVEVGGLSRAKAGGKTSTAPLLGTSVAASGASTVAGATAAVAAGAPLSPDGRGGPSAQPHVAPSTRGSPPSSRLPPWEAAPVASHSLSRSRDGAAGALLLPSAQALSAVAAKIDKEYNYYCHPDCAMGMEVVPNPQFNAAISSHIEAAFALDWRRTVQMAVERLGGSVDGHHLSVRDPSPCDDDRAAEEPAVKREKKSEAEASGTVWPAVAEMDATAASAFDRLLAEAGGNAHLACELSRLYSQLRAEAWADYFQQERHHSGHPLFYPPPFVDVLREAALSHVLEAASPNGQAARLYLLDAATHPVGSAVAIPLAVLTRWQQSALAPLIKVNDSNNFVAEAALAVANEAVVPETVTVYRSCNKEGRVVAS